uniref:Prophage protein n=2 Tax=Caenorhabditis tropicalis TaxID=1561998 RepID=A0A1I7TVI7_9PELO
METVFEDHRLSVQYFDGDKKDLYTQYKASQKRKAHIKRKKTSSNAQYAREAAMPPTKFLFFSNVDTQCAVAVWLNLWQKKDKVDKFCPSCRFKMPNMPHPLNPWILVKNEDVLEWIRRKK